MPDRLEQFLSMGGYGAYVWGAYGLCAVVMVLLVVLTLKRLRANERTLKMLDGLRASRRQQSMGNGDAP
ncbi:MAG: heme exporter protein CcmD [Rhodospirillaceae bacterium]|nr:heme exporter protein CcmD [Rhodospirillaceae bacterium]